MAFVINVGKRIRIVFKFWGSHDTHTRFVYNLFDKARGCYPLSHQVNGENGITKERSCLY